MCDEPIAEAQVAALSLNRVYRVPWLAWLWAGINGYLTWEKQDHLELLKSYWSLEGEMLFEHGDCDSVWRSIIIALH